MHGQGIRISRRVAHSRPPVSRLSGEVNRIERSTAKLEGGIGRWEERGRNRSEERGRSEKRGKRGKRQEGKGRTRNEGRRKEIKGKGEQKKREGRGRRGKKKEGKGA